MLVLVCSPSPEDVAWCGRRHDDTARGALRGEGVPLLFDEVFRALHDGEQVAIGFPAPLSVPADEAAGPPAVWAPLGQLLRQVGQYRPWTVVSTSMARWRATTSMLLWEAPDREPADAVEAFYGVVAQGMRPAGQGQAEPVGGPTGPVVNLAVTAARDAGLTVEVGELSEPSFSISAVPAGTPLQ